jgi:prophage regulatory protein
MQETTLPNLQRIKQVIQITGLSRSTIYQLIGKGEFPRPVQLSTRRVAWDSRVVTAWIESRPQTA